MNKKDQHIKLAHQQVYTSNGLENVEIEYYSMPKYNFDQIDISTKILGIDLQVPFYINAMTLGGKQSDLINEQLYRIAQKYNLLFCPGSISPYLDNLPTIYPYSVLNIGLDKDPQLIIDYINNQDNIKILQLHLNPLQELVTSTDINFHQWRENLKYYLKHSKKAIMIKETGCGMNYKQIKELVKLGVKAIDISGKGGSNFPQIEKDRIKSNFSLTNLGYNTYQSLINTQNFVNYIDIIASGGIKSVEEVYKALSLGTKAVAVSKYFLDILLVEGEEKLAEEIEKWIRELKILLLLSNKKDIYSLTKSQFKIKE